jgi:YidC/Oxa1 family membrane protein insertase
MFSYLYNTFIFFPLYNGLIGLMAIIPWADAGIAAIIFTVIVRLILFPLSRKAIVAQVRMRELQPELDKLKVTYKDDRQAQSVKMMELYKQKGVNPFSSILLLLIQLPIMYALYSVFIHSGLPVVNHTILYHFISTPVINIHFLGLIDITKSSWALALVAAVAQYLQLEFSLNAMKSTATPTLSGQPAKPTQADMAQNMTKNMKYVFPVVIFIIGFRLPAVLPIYWATTNLFTMIQEIVVRRRLAHLKTIAAEKAYLAK